MKSSQPIRLEKINAEKRSAYMNYLLLADESEAIVRTYFMDGEMYAILTGEATIGIVLFVFHPDKVVEIKNLALHAHFRSKGFGTQTIEQAVTLYSKKGFHKMIVGTANSSIQNLAFYQKAGFRMTEIKKDFFLQYPDPIIENGIRASDMVLFERELDSKE